MANLNAKRPERQVSSRLWPPTRLDLENHFPFPGVASRPGNGSSRGHRCPTPTPQLGGRQNDLMQGLAQVPGDPLAPAPRPYRPEEWKERPQETPGLARPLPRGAQDAAFLAGTSPRSWGATVGVGQGSGREGWVLGRALTRPTLLTRASAETSPPARAAPRSPARRLSPEREPGRGQSAGSSGRSGSPGRARRRQRIRRSRRRSQELQPPLARAEALSYLPPSASAPPRPGAQAD